MRLSRNLSEFVFDRRAVAVAASLAIAPLGAVLAHGAAADAGLADLGPNVIVFDPSMSAGSIPCASSASKTTTLKCGVPKNAKRG